MDKWLKALEGISWSEWNELQVLISNEFHEEIKKVRLNFEK